MLFLKRARQKTRRPAAPPCPAQVEQLEERTLLAAIVMDAREQLLLELINRARLDPPAEAARQGISLNQGLTAGTISTAPKQPLAPHQALINAARAHSQDMLDNDYFSHTSLDGRTFDQRIFGAGYPSGTVGENLSWGGSTGSIDRNAHVVLRHDSLYSSPGHRVNIFHPSFKEVGNGIRYGIYTTTSGTNFNASMVTENFGGRSNTVFITGVAFDDSIVNDSFYSIGYGATGALVSEGIGDVTVTAVLQGSGQTFVTTTGSAGGYTLQVPTGTYTVTATGGGLNAPYVVENVTVQSENVKVDFDSSQAPSADTLAPTATLAAQNITTSGGTTHSFTVTYADNVAVNVSTLDSSDLQVTGPGGFSALATFVSVNTNSDGTPRVGTYQINAPGGTWDLADNGTYTVTLRANQVRDTSSNSAASGSLGTFTVNLSPPSPIVLDGTTVTVNGTSGDDVFTFLAGSTLRVGMNGETRSFSSTAVNSVKFLGRGGDDGLTITGSSVAETALLRPLTVTYTGAGFTLTGTQIETIRIISGGGADNATLLDSAGNDRLTARPTFVRLSGSGFDNRVDGFPLVTAKAIAGGNDDRADFYDSAENDRVYLKPTYTEIIGSNFRTRGIGFDRAFAHATAGGADDRAWFYDSNGDDTFTATPVQAVFVGAGFNNTANGFDRVFAYSASGGQDTAELHDSQGNDRLAMKSGYSRMNGTGFYNYVRRFSLVTAHATAGGSDRVDFYDSVGDDHFIGRPGHSQMIGQGFENHAHGFDKAYAYAPYGGEDRADLHDSQGDDRFASRPGYARIDGSGFYIDTRAFKQVYAHATQGNDTAQVLYLKTGERVTGAGAVFMAFRGNRYEELNGFDSVKAGSAPGQTPSASIIPDQIDFLFSQVGTWLP